MNKAFFAIAIAVTLVLTAAGVVFAAAKNSEPGHLLYPAKAWIEQQQNRTETQNLEQLQLQQPQEPTATGEMLREQDRVQIREMDRIHETETVTPQHINSQNPWTAGTPSPGSGYGPDHGTCSICDGLRQHQNGQQNGSNPGNGNKP